MILTSSESDQYTSTPNEISKLPSMYMTAYFYRPVCNVQYRLAYVMIFSFSALDIHCWWNYLNDNGGNSVQMVSSVPYCCYAIFSMFHIEFNVYHHMQIYHLFSYL